MTRGTFLRSTVLPTCSTTNASSGMRQSARPRERAFGASEKNARSTPNGTTLMRRSSPSHVASSRFSHSVPTMYDRASRSAFRVRSEEHTSELQSLAYLVCRLLLEKKKNSVCFRRGGVAAHRYCQQRA